MPGWLLKTIVALALVIIASLIVLDLLPHPVKGHRAPKNVVLTRADREELARYYADNVKAREMASQKFNPLFAKIATEGVELNTKMASLLSAANLVTEAGLANAEAFVRQYRAYITKKNNALLGLQKEITKELDSYHIQSQPFWDAYNQRKARGIQQIGELFKADNEILDTMDKMLAFIKSHLAHCKVVDNQLVFDEPALNKEYLDFIAMINEYNNQENKILELIKNQDKYETTGIEINIKAGLKE